MDYYEHEIAPDEWIVGDVYTDRDDDPAAYERKLRKKYDTVKRDVNAIDGLSVRAPDFATLIATKKREKAKAVSFILDLNRSSLVLTVGPPAGTRFVLGKQSVPSDLEEYRLFLEGLVGWSDGDHPLVSEADFKAWSRKNPKKPTVYKTYEELARKSKADTEAFRAWAKANSTGKKVLEEAARTEKLKPADPARVKALKLLDATLAAYYKTF
ncbi:MAG: hypothetical protein K8R60_03265 [Burkholderiales bacterium]|nr:hypothetical protein [Burkholderiales bacterium]